MNVTATIESTGEVLELACNTPEQCIDSLLLVNSALEAYELLKNKLKKHVETLIETPTYQHAGHLLRISNIQRTIYDPFVLRQVFDEDTLATFMEQKKGRIDKYIKEHLPELGDNSTTLRNSLLPVGKPFKVIKLEKLERAS